MYFYSIYERDLPFIFEKLYLLEIKRKNKEKRRERKFPLLLSIPHMTLSQLLYSKIQSVSCDSILGMLYSLKKTLMLGKIEGKRRREQQKMRWLDSITDLMDMSLNKLQEIVKERGAWHASVSGVSKSWTQLSN